MRNIYLILNATIGHLVQICGRCYLLPAYFLDLQLSRPYNVRERRQAVGLASKMKDEDKTASIIAMEKLDGNNI